jgi:hypothetical protein
MVTGRIEALSDSERPDFLVTTAVGTLELEVTAYHGRVGDDDGSKGRAA